MITDEIVEAMDMMIDMCSNEEQARGDGINQRNALRF